MEYLWYDFPLRNNSNYTIITQMKLKWNSSPRRLTNTILDADPGKYKIVKPQVSETGNQCTNWQILTGYNCLVSYNFEIEFFMNSPLKETNNQMELS